MLCDADAQLAGEIARAENGANSRVGHRRIGGAQHDGKAERLAGSLCGVKAAGAGEYIYCSQRWQGTTENRLKPVYHSTLPRMEAPKAICPVTAGTTLSHSL